MSKLMKVDRAYKQWIIELSERFRISQLSASIRVNTEMLRFYWLLGKDLVVLKAESKWGDGIIKTVSQDLRSQFPDVKGFSETNIDYMKRFYTLYSHLIANSPQAVGELNNTIEISPQAVGELNNTTDFFPQVASELFQIPWGHHRYIIDKLRGNPEKALFFVRMTLKNGWSRAVLLNFLNTDLYERQGKALSNLFARCY